MPPAPPCLTSRASLLIGPSPSPRARCPIPSPASRRRTWHELFPEYPHRRPDCRTGAGRGARHGPGADPADPRAGGRGHHRHRAGLRTGLLARQGCCRARIPVGRSHDRARGRPAGRGRPDRRDDRGSRPGHRHPRRRLCADRRDNVGPAPRHHGDGDCRHDRGRDRQRHGGPGRGAGGAGVSEMAEQMHVAPALNTTEALLGRTYRELFDTRAQLAEVIGQLQAQRQQIEELTAAVDQLKAEPKRADEPG
ncbi:hypothetical protein EMVG_00024 [Emiliania huxleyi virus PS401]|nr:hypothetical protein EMVG_00024 [Emiliania huxleyi virus PS401]